MRNADGNVNGNTVSYRNGHSYGNSGMYAWLHDNDGGRNDRSWLDRHRQSR
jgi:hypothetical protein